MKTLTRNGDNGKTLHALNYSYDLTGTGNAISRISLGGTSSGNYIYDANGNLTTGGYSGNQIRYNVLNLPQEITKGSEKISYIYTATGEKLAMQTANSLTYCRGAMVYNGNSFGYLLHPEGLVHKSSTGWNYDYQLTDHVGSTRVLLEASGNTLTSVQTTDYYPFSLAFSTNNLNKNKYLFGGKEYQDGMLGGTTLGLYDFGARYYNPMLGRWFCQDPALQLMSPYGYCGNNPICYVDPDGEFFWEAVVAGVIMGGIMGGAKADMAGKNFWNSFWKGALVGLVDAALWEENIGKAMLYGGISGGLFATLTSDDLINLTKGEGWYNNDKVFNNMKARGEDKQEKLNFFGFEGKYNPKLRAKNYEAEDYWGATNINSGEISYGNLAFENYATLKATNVKELYHAQKILSGKSLAKLPIEYWNQKPW